MFFADRFASGARLGVESASSPRQVRDKGVEMPYLQAMAERVNWALGNRENITAVKAAHFRQGQDLVDAAKALGIAVSQEEIDTFAAWPLGMREAVRAAIYASLTRDQRVPITFAWAPGYDYELSIWEAAGSEKSLGGMTILMKSRYPLEAEPPGARPAASIRRLEKLTQARPAAARTKPKAKPKARTKPKTKAKSKSRR